MCVNDCSLLRDEMIVPQRTFGDGKWFTPHILEKEMKNVNVRKHLELQKDRQLPWWLRDSLFTPQYEKRPLGVPFVAEGARLGVATALSGGLLYLERQAVQVLVLSQVFFVPSSSTL